jgi:Domain of unknown function (DUF4440)
MRIPSMAIAILLLLSSSGAIGSGQGQQLPTTQAPLAPASSHVIEILRGLEANYLRAEMEDDAKVADSILAEDFVGIRSDGSASNREDILNNLAKHQRSREPYRIAATNMREYVFGDTACVTYTKVYTLTNNRPPYSENVMHIFTFKGFNWRLQVSSPIPRPSH